MRTTLTLDDDIARQLKEIARATDQSFKDVVNQSLRRGLAIGEVAPTEAEPFLVRAKSCGFRTGVDPTKLNQLYDELEAESDLGVHEP